LANIRSQIKRNKQNEKRREHNVKVKSSIRTAARKVERAVEEGKENPENLTKLYINLVKTIDKAAGAGVVPRKRAARKKSRVAKRVNAAIKAKA
jgi:small subunit ribosomal protein S20